MNSQPPVPESFSRELQVARPDSGIPRLQPYGIYPEAEESIFRHYWRILYKHRLLIAGIALAGLLAGLVVSMLTQPQYSGTVTIQVAREEAKVLNIEGVEETGGTRFDAEFYQTQYALLKSRSLSEAVVRDLRLADNYLFLSGFDQGEVEGVRQLSREERTELATSMVNKNTVVSPVRMSSIINVSFISPNPELSAQVANSIAENFIEANLSRRYEAAAYARQFLQNRLSQVRARLEESERRAVQYAQQQGLVKLQSGDGTSVSEQSIVANDLADLSRQLAVARADRAQAEARYRSGTQGTAAAESLGNTALNELRRQRAELQAQLSKLQSDFGPQYPTVVALRAQINELDRQIGTEEGRVSSSVAQDLSGRYRQALATEQALQRRVDALKAQLLDERSRSIQFNIIQRDVDTNRALYDALLQRFKEVGVAGGIGTNNVSVVDPALTPEKPVKPNLPLNLFIGLLLGLLGGVAAAYILEQLQDAAILPSDFSKKVGVPLLGSTPKMASKEATKTALLDPKAPLSESYFSILTSVQFSTSHGAPRSMVLTSSQAGEGKSTTSLALAQGLASVGAKVLLMDGDLRNPSLHKLLGRPLGSGLSNLLTGSGSIGEHVQESGTDNLTVLLAGPIPPNPAELLSTDMMHRIVQQALRDYDHVVIDGPPVLGLADAPLLARAVEGTILVVEASRTRSAQARQAIERLRMVRANLLGAILTKLDARTEGYGYGYTYEYSYGAAN